MAAIVPQPVFCGRLAQTSPLLPGQDELIAISIPLSQRFTIGRHADACIPLPSISSLHFWISASQGASGKRFHVVLHNEGSNGIWIDGRFLWKGAAIELAGWTSVVLPLDKPGSWLALLFVPYPIGSVFSHYSISEKVGFGGFGTVHKAVSRITGSIRAVKVVQYDEATEDGSLVRREVRMLRGLHHDHIIGFFGAFPQRELSDVVAIVMEWAPFGSLAEMIEDGSIVRNHELVSNASLQVAKGLAYIHSLRVIHRDIKPSNILVTAKNPLMVKIGDFGCAIQIQKGQMCQDAGGGTPPYWAPEFVQEEPYNTQVDCFAFGVMIFELLCGKLPFYSYEWDYQPIPKRMFVWGKQPKWTDIRKVHWERMQGICQWGDRTYTFLSYLMNWDPRKRWSIADTLEQSCVA